MIEKQIDINTFHAMDIRVGTIVSVEVFEKAHKPSFKLRIDFGNEIGIRQSSAQITVRYHVEDLIGKQVVAVINLPPRQIANFISQCLVLGVVGQEGDVVLLAPEQPVANGLKIA
jgi:tRNA-binding protein